MGKRGEQYLREYQQTTSTTMMLKLSFPSARLTIKNSKPLSNVSVTKMTSLPTIWTWSPRKLTTKLRVQNTHCFILIKTGAIKIVSILLISCCLLHGCSAVMDQNKNKRMSFGTYSIPLWTTQFLILLLMNWLMTYSTCLLLWITNWSNYNNYQNKSLAASNF